MKLSWTAMALVLEVLTTSPVNASFSRDVVHGSNRQAIAAKQNLDVEESLLEKAVPVETYSRNLRARGFDAAADELDVRRLDQGDDNGGDDDYYVADAYKYSFGGYSLKYAKCQPVQRFSEDAIAAGEYTPMLIDDIVVLRLCPYRFCTTSMTYGCHYNYAEYAIGLSDYVRTMLRYTEDKKAQLCDWCDACAAGRRLDQAQDGQDDNNGDGDQADDQGDNNENGDNQDNGDNADGDQADDGNDNNANENQADDADGADNYYAYGGDDDDADGCGSYQTYCFDSDSVSICDAAEDDTYMNNEDYLNYLDCVQIRGDDEVNYFVRPSCNGSDGTFKMEVFFDQFCSQFAGNQVNLKQFGLGFQSSMFETFYSNTCIDCSETDYPPNFNSNSNMCNKIHATGAKCTQNLQYQLFGDDAADSSTECSFIESLRMGTYDADGELYVGGSSQSSRANRAVTDVQKVGLGVSIALVMLLALYSCFLHHSITNLLIKSLSHTDLLPPSRHKSPRSGKVGSVRSRSATRRRKKADDE